MMLKPVVVTFLFSIPFFSIAQSDRWQQRIFYQIDIDFDVRKHQFEGKQRMVYQNNSPDTLDRVFFHLFFNAFIPGSMMDVRSRTLPDPDKRIGDRIQKLKEDEIGIHLIKSLKMNGIDQKYEVVETILEVTLTAPIMPGSSAVFDMEYESQVPVQIRRSGRNNAEGIDYSMAQWFPKMCEYDYQGWHANPYVAREFYGVWGDFDVKISIDKDYIIAATGYLQNPHEIGYGYEKSGETVDRPKGKKLTWHFFAPNVHDFVWAADRDYTHEKLVRADGLTLHFFYQPNEKTKTFWPKLIPAMDEAFHFINKKYGPYPYQQYSFIQGGDGGMEYPMATLITGERSLGSLIGVSIHELLHSWYQMMLATNEILYPWMDEGFTNWAEEEVLNHLMAKGLFPDQPSENPHLGSVEAYRKYALSGKEEPLSTHADHYMTNYAYGLSSYVKGAVLLEQLRYILGDEKFYPAMLRYYWEWRFKHPNLNDFIRVMEKSSGLELDWFKEYFVNTTHTIDYAVKTVEKERNGSTKVTLERKGIMPMPVDLLITYQDGTREYLTIPLVIMRGQKEQENKDLKYTVLPDWQWTNPTYEFHLQAAPETIQKIQIDPSGRLADIHLDNNTWKSE